MQNYNAYYQNGTYTTDENMRSEYAFNLPSSSTHTFDPSLFESSRHYPNPTYDSSLTPSDSSQSGSLFSPNSIRSSLSASGYVHTPLTSPSLSSSHHLKEELSFQDTWFGSMQESYLSNNRQSIDCMSLRPLGQPMQRMSISAPVPPSDLRHQAAQNNGAFLSNPTQEAPRRASVVTFQPTSSRPSSSAPRRPSIQHSSAYSEPIFNAKQKWNNQRQSLPRPSPLSNYTFNLPAQPLPTISQQLSTPSNESGENVDRLFAEVFGMQTDIPTTHITDNSVYGQQNVFAQSSSIPTYPPPPMYQPSQTQPEKYNFAGVLLQPEDFHMLEAGPLSSPSEPVYSHQQPGLVPQQPGWQTSFSLGPAGPSSVAYSSPPSQPGLPMQGVSAPASAWNSTNFHGFEPLTSPTARLPPSQQMSIDRASSAPPPGESFDGLNQKSGAERSMDRRRGSSIDSALVLPVQPTSSTYQPSAAYMQEPVHVTQVSSAYLGPGSGFTTTTTAATINASSKSTLATRRSSMGPQPLNLANRSYQPYPSAPLTLSNTYSSPPSFGGGRIPLTSPPISPTKRSSSVRSPGSRKASAASAPTFINFTSKDANKLLTGVAPSGSSKRKREEEELARIAKLAKDGQEMIVDSSS